MPLLQALRWLLLGIEAVIALPVVYLCIVSISAILAARKGKNDTNSSSLTSRYANFAILIPAHNEVAVLGKLLESLAALDYPKDHFDVYIVADNCTDTTAELARATGWLHVYERFNEEERGKGFALNWLLQKLDEDRLVYDAYVVLDADSVIAPSFLQVMSKGLAQGAQALQAYNTVLNATDSPGTALRWLALTLMNYVRPLGRNGLGCSSTLTGNGMCLSRSLLIRYPWQAFSLAEDYQYYLSLVQHGEKVIYMPEAIVRSEMPSTFAQMRTQDIRWEASDLGQGHLHIALKLLRDGLKARDIVRIEAIAELLTPPLSFLVCIALLTFVCALLVWFPLDVLGSIALFIGLFFYVGTAFYFLRPPLSVYKVFLSAPGFMLWKLWVYLVLRRNKKRPNTWEHTPRLSDDSTLGHEARQAKTF